MADDAPPNESQNQTSAPQNATVERLNHRRDGRYLIAPDSAEPLPAGIWSRGDYDAVLASADAAAARWTAMDEAVSPPRPYARRVIESGAAHEGGATGALLRLFRRAR